MTFRILAKSELREEIVVVTPFQVRKLPRSELDPSLDHVCSS